MTVRRDLGRARALGAGERDTTSHRDSRLLHTGAVLTRAADIRVMLASLPQPLPPCGGVGEVGPDLPGASGLGQLLPVVVALSPPGQTSVEAPVSEVTLMAALSNKFPPSCPLPCGVSQRLIHRGMLPRAVIDKEGTAGFLQCHPLSLLTPVPPPHPTPPRGRG